MKVRTFLLGLLALALLVPAVAAAKPPKKHKKPAPATAALHFSGKTSQGKPISFVLAAGHKQITALKLGYTLDCGDGGAPIDVANDQFGDTGTATVAANGSFVAKDLKSSVSGSIAGTNAHGTIDLVAEMTDQSGAPIGTCSSGSVTWTATGR